MQTVVTSQVQQAAPPAPWLEQAKGADQPRTRIPLEPFPFRIGRCGTANLKIDSGRVSREHAVIEARDGCFVARDLGSTNGTFVNGERIEEAELRDGDMLVIADVELTFFSGAAGAGDPVTQAFTTTRFEGSYLELVRDVRRLHEALTSRSLEPRLEPVVLLQSGNVVGCEALHENEAACAARRGLRPAAAECRLNARLLQLERLVAADLAASLDEDAWLFVNLDPNEVGGDELVDSLVQVRRVLGPRQRLIVDVPDSVVSDAPLLHDFRASLRGEQIAVAHDGFAAGAAQVRQLRKLAPDFLKLAGAAVREGLRSDARRRQLQDVVAAANDIACQTIATGVHVLEEAEMCRELGCPLAQGSFFSAKAEVPS
jgi:EAL domain-containing protein (putative c-di-GMP-specific phosphodiesterase class I)